MRVRLLSNQVVASGAGYTDRVLSGAEGTLLPDPVDPPPQTITTYMVNFDGRDDQIEVSALDIEEIP